MARPKKIGLDYFTNDVNFYQDIKIRKLIRHKGVEAVSVYHILLCRIYKDGYYISWDDELPYVISEISCLEENKIKEIIMLCMEIGLFCKELFDNEKIITSKGIQERYFNTCVVAKRRLSGKLPYLIIELPEKLISEETQISSERNGVIPEIFRNNTDKTSINSEKTGIYSEETPIISENSTQSKEKGSKEKESKVTDSKEYSPAFACKSVEVGKEQDNRVLMTVSVGVGILKSDRDWLLSMMSKFLINKKEILEWLIKFDNESTCRGKQEHDNLVDIKQHFNNWLDMKLKSRPSINVDNQGLSSEKHWIPCYVELCRSVTAEVGKMCYDDLQFECFDVNKRALLLDVQTIEVFDYIEEHLLNSAYPILQKHYGAGIKVNYRVLEKQMLKSFSC